MQVKNMNLIMENWRNFNNNKDLMLVEVEFNKILEEEQAILDDFEELMEHYRSGGILLENKKVAILEKKLSNTRNAEFIKEVKKNPSLLNEAGILTAASIPTAVGLIMKFVSWTLEKGVEFYINRFAQQELPEEYAARMSSQQEVEGDPTQAPSVASSLGRGTDPEQALNNPEFLKALERERGQQAQSQSMKYLIRKKPRETDQEYNARLSKLEKEIFDKTTNSLYTKLEGESDQQFQKRTNSNEEENKRLIILHLLGGESAIRSASLRGKAQALNPNQKKVIMAILNIAQRSEDWGNYIKDIVKLALKKLSKFVGAIINKACRTTEEAEEKKQKIEKVFENIATVLYIGLICGGVATVVQKASELGIQGLNLIVPKAFGAVGTLADSASTAAEMKSATAAVVDIKTSLSSVSDTALAGAKAEKLTHLSHYVSEFIKSIKQAGTQMITEVMDLIGDCIASFAFFDNDMPQRAASGVKSAFNKIRGFFGGNKEQSAVTERRIIKIRRTT